MKLHHLLPLIVGLAAGAGSLNAWDYDGHRAVNELALASLPKDFPAFVHAPANAERIAFLAGEPDRWRNVPDLPIKHFNGLDHYIDLEDMAAAGVKPADMSDLRQVFAQQVATARQLHPDKFAPIDPNRNSDHTAELVGFLPWAITEYYGKLRAEFSYLKAFEDAGTPVEIENAKANIVYVMGVMGHYVGDGAQPLHTTKHHHGWVGDNPHGYTTWMGFHAWIDGGFSGKVGLTPTTLFPHVTPVAPLSLAPRADGRDPVFDAVMDYLVAQHALLEPLYALEKAGKLKVEPGAHNAEGRAFIEGQWLKAGEMLGAIWLTAWRSSPPDTYLRAQLLKRQAAAVPAVAKP